MIYTMQNLNWVSRESGVHIIQVCLYFGSFQGISSRWKKVYLFLLRFFSFLIILGLQTIIQGTQADGKINIL